MTLDAVTEDGIQGSKNGNGENSEEINATVQERSNRILNLISGTGDGVDMGTFMRYLGIQRSVYVLIESVTSGRRVRKKTDIDF